MATGVEMEQLRVRHRQLEQEIEAENARPSPDDAHMATLKKQKLRVKDEISRLEGSG